MIDLSLDEARALMLDAQGLFYPPRGSAGAEDLLTTIERLGAVQIDTIRVVERSQYLVLWSRHGAYDRELLDTLLYPDRRVFEYWCHAASIIPMRDYRYTCASLLRSQEHLGPDTCSWMQEHPIVLAETLAAIRERGSLSSTDFAPPENRQALDPWHWYGQKESRRALEILWTRGDLMVHRRRGGQKVYDLRERVIREAPADPAGDALPDEPTRRLYLLQRTIESLGVSTLSWLPDYYRLRLPASGPASKRAVLAEALETLRERGEILLATVDGLREPAVLSRQALPMLERLREGETPGRTVLLSPFDNLLWDRARTRTLFQYDVVFEAYVPPQKRRYGYYSLAILHQGRLVGRLDAKAERAAHVLRVHALFLEPHVRPEEPLLQGLGGTLRSLADFLGLQEIVVGRSDPPGVAPALQESLSVSSEGKKSR